MNKLISAFTAGLVLGGVLGAGALISGPLMATAAGLSPQASGKSQSTVKIVLDNARVRVRDVTFPPGVTGMHTHDLPHVGVVIQGGTLVFKQVTFPEWWLYSLIAFCGALLVIEFVRLLARTLRGEDTLAHRQATA